MIYILNLKYKRGWKGKYWTTHGAYLDRDLAEKKGQKIEENNSQIVSYDTEEVEVKGEFLEEVLINA